MLDLVGNPEYRFSHDMACLLTEKRYKDTLHHSPCRDTCVAVQESLAEDSRIRERGKRLKHTYLEAGKKVHDTVSHS